MAKRPDGAAAGTQRVTFTKPAAERIGKVVRTVEAGNRDQGPLTFGPRGVPSGMVFRVCTFTGSWSINASKEVTFRGVTTTPNTAVAVNLFAAITASSSSRPCAIAKDGTAWYLIAAQC